MANTRVNKHIYTHFAKVPPTNSQYVYGSISFLCFSVLANI